MTRVCITCGCRLDGRNTSGYCKAHRCIAHLPAPAEFARIADGMTAPAAARIIGCDVNTVRNWAEIHGFSLARGFGGRPATRKPQHVIRNLAAVEVAA
ncbi:hypothetical protein ABIC65_001063 [Sphingomonas trueperi]|uniref:hypothetical protein n=1 Tax=Sphingomonas trueperi TaxID=53317 RepID=UPI003391979E